MIFIREYFILFLNEGIHHLQTQQPLLKVVTNYYRR